MYGQVGKETGAQRANQQKLNSAAQCAEPLREMPLMEIEFSRLSDSLAGLDASVVDLLQRIQPICQPNRVDTKEDCCTAGLPEATPSEMRSKLLGLRLRVDAIAIRIAEVRYTIEV